MAPPFIGKKLNKSFVRVPGSGKDKSANPSVCNLGWASSLAAGVNVPAGRSLYCPNQQSNKSNEGNDIPLLNVPQNITVSTNISNTDSDRKRTMIETSTGALQKVLPPSGHPWLHSMKRPLIEDDSSNMQQSKKVCTKSLEKLCNVNEIPRSLMKMIYLKPDKEQDNKDKEIERLRKENVALQKQVSLFKQLICNPQRLDSIRKRLSERNDQNKSDKA